MSLWGKRFIVLVMAFATIALSIASVGASALSVQSFDILTSSTVYYTPQGVYSGKPFGIGIFSYDANGDTTDFDGTAYLSITEGVITPSTVNFTRGAWFGIVTITETDLAVITVRDSEGHTGTSDPIQLLASANNCPRNTVRGRI